MQRVIDGAKSKLDALVRVDESPVAQHLYEQAQARARLSLSPRERAAELVVGGLFLAVALALALSEIGKGGASPTTTLLLIACFALVSLVEFDVGGSYTVPSQIVFVPMLLLLAPEIVPLCVTLGLMLARVPDCIRGHRSPKRLLLALGDSWFAIGPSAVLVLSGAPSPSHVTAWMIAACVVTQVVVDFAASASREVIIGGGAGPQLGESAWIYLVDLLLWPIGLLVALAAEHHRWAIVLLLSFALLLRLFSFERRARLDQLSELTNAYLGTAVLLGDVVEADHEYTGEHSRGVVELAVAVAQELGLDAAARQRVEFGALLHDVGKIAIPKAIIDKPGPLDDAEWELMKTHTVEGERMLKRVGGLLADVGRVVRASHEHFDGGGYPDGLAGEDIPIEARIIACCDAFSAMTTDRSYRRGRSAREAAAELNRCAGTQFDPRVVIALVTVLMRTDAHSLGAPSSRDDETPSVEMEHLLLDAGSVS